MPSTRSSTFWRELVPGLLLTVLGILLVLHNFGFIQVRGLWKFWPSLLIIWGVARIISGLRDGRMAGILLLAGGTALQASYLGWLRLSWQMLFRYWPLLLIGFGVKMLLAYQRQGNLTGGLMLLGLGIVLQLHELRWLPFSPWRLWPVALIFVGVGLLQRALTPGARAG